MMLMTARLVISTSIVLMTATGMISVGATSSVITKATPISLGFLIGGFGTCVLLTWKIAGWVREMQINGRELERLAAESKRCDDDRRRLVARVDRLEARLEKGSDHG